MTRWVPAFAAATLALCIWPVPAAADGGWRGALVASNETPCEFSEIPVEATVSGGRVAIRMTFEGRKRTFEASIGGDSAFKAYTLWHTRPGHGDGGPQHATIKGAIAGGTLKADFWTMGVPRRFCSGKVRLARAEPVPPPSPRRRPSPRRPLRCRIRNRTRRRRQRPRRPRRARTHCWSASSIRCGS